MPLVARMTWRKERGSLSFDGNVRHFPTFIADEPPEFHGGDTGPSSIEYLLISIGACQGTSFGFAIDKYNAKIKNIEIEVKGDMHHIDRHGELDKFKGLLRLIGVEVAFSIEPEDYSKENLENIDMAFRAFKKYCVVTESVRRGIPSSISYDIVRKGSQDVQI
ncbi:MAG: OsmC family peroxiredoxin [Candidatus Lokiarchaeota archaeon]|nr:OsmC family peroxiredoxin [Candidatus Lokiarchaeota archaeon]